MFAGSQSHQVAAALASENFQHSQSHDLIDAAPGFGRFGGQNISLTGVHVGVLTKHRYGERASAVFKLVEHELPQSVVIAGTLLTFLIRYELRITRRMPKIREKLCQLVGGFAGRGDCDDK